MIRRWFVWACLATFSGASSAVCFDPNALHRYPSAGTEIYFDLQYALELEKTAVKPGAQPKKGQRLVSLNYAAYAHQHEPQTPPASWLNSIDPRKYDAKTFFKDPYVDPKDPPPDENFVAFYEPDGKGGRRICRAEEWVPRFPNGPRKPGDHDYKDVWGEPTLSNFPVLKALTSAHRPRLMYLYRYDTAGRLSQWGMHDIDSEWKPGRTDYVDDTARRSECFIYDNAGRLSQYIMSPPSDGVPCTQATRENSSRMLYRYDAGGRYVGSVQQSGHGEPKPAISTGSASRLSPDPVHVKWYETYRLRPQPDVYHEAEADALWGLRFVTGLPQIENVSDRKVPDDQLRAIYRFPQPTPTSVMDGLPMSVKAYRRVRIGPATASGTASEMYPANGGITERILSRNMGGNVFRHERFNKDGKVYQVINDGLLEDGKPSTLYQEDLVTLDKVLAHPKINVPRTHVRLRVYEVDAAGKPTLTAISWARALSPQATRTLGRGGPIIDIYKDAKKAWADRGKPATKPPTEDDLRVRYTDVNGKEIWADWDVFLKATGFIEFEQAFYPHGHPMNKKPPIDWKGAAIQ
jgi:hypothetical protein